MQDLVLASGNKGKMREFGELLKPFGFNVVPQSEFDLQGVDETGLSFVENAILKARFAAEKTGLPALADDSGLAVDALGGEPGIFSARYAGAGASDEDNITKLLHEMQNVASQNRGAEFHCALVYMRHAADPMPIICQGVWRGEIATREHGSGGFGYDPVFWVPERSCTAAELTREQKSSMSHRGHATRLLADYFKHG